MRWIDDVDADCMGAGGLEPQAQRARTATPGRPPDARSASPTAAYEAFSEALSAPLLAQIKGTGVEAGGALGAEASASISDFDVQHQALKELLGGHYGAPITAGGSPGAILHLGCGRGHWGVIMALVFPRAQVTSLDLVTPQGDDDLYAQLAPDNHVALAADPYAALPFADGAFDFVRWHPHQLCPLLPEERWPTFLAELMRVTRPGGWIELIQGAPPTGGGPALERLSTWITRALEGCGVNAGRGRELGALLREAGSARGRANTIELRLGARSDWLGRLMGLHVYTLLGGFEPLVCAQRLASPDAFRQALADARAELFPPHGPGASGFEAGMRPPPVFPLTYAYGQRP